MSLKSIRHLIGDLNYYELQHLYPKVFIPIVTIEQNRSNYTDVITWAIDGYSPEELLRDLRRILNKKEPVNKLAYKLVIEGDRNNYWCPTTHEFIIYVAIMSIIAICIYYTIFNIYIEHTFDNEEKSRIYNVMVYH
jgi:hypothetical protein